MVKLVSQYFGGIEVCYQPFTLREAQKVMVCVSQNSQSIKSRICHGTSFEIGRASCEAHPSLRLSGRSSHRFEARTSVLVRVGLFDLGSRNVGTQSDTQIMSSSPLSKLSPPHNAESCSTLCGGAGIEPGPKAPYITVYVCTCT